MPLNDCEFNLILTWSSNCVIIYANVANQNRISEMTEMTKALCSSSYFINLR